MPQIGSGGAFSKAYNHIRHYLFTDGERIGARNRSRIAFPDPRTPVMDTA